jgi:hypothetical protein
MFCRHRIADQHEVGALGQKAEVQQAQNASLVLCATLVMAEVEGVDAGLRLQA